MENVYVSDLFGSNITKNTPIVIINVNVSNLYFKQIASEGNTTIYEYNKYAINEILKDRDVDPDNFLILGHVLSKKGSNPKIIILGNKNICKNPTQYDQVSTYDGGKIIRPFYISSNGKKSYSLGLFFIKSNTIDISEIGIMQSNLLIDFKRSSKSQSIFDSNEFNLLSVPSKFPMKTIARTPEVNNKFKLLNGGDKYLTILDNGIMVKQGMDSLPQIFSYSAQGELTNDNKCIEYNGSKVFAETCNSNPNQKWLVSQSTIQPSNDFGKCLDVSNLDNTTILLNDCDSSFTQSWSTESNELLTINPDNEHVNSTDDISWDKYQGKTVVLVENNNPWFVNHDTVVRINPSNIASEIFDSDIFKNDPSYQPNFLTNMRNNVDFKSSFIIDPESPNLGYGHSFAARGGTLCQPSMQSQIQPDQIEGFDGLNQHTNFGLTESQLCAIIILLVILIIAYKIWKH